MPLAIVDKRIVDLAIQFKQNPDASIMSGYRRLEDIIRKRTGFIHEHGDKLFSRVFMQDNSPLFWENLHPGEHTGRVQLLPAIYKGYRSYRAHKETGGDVGNNIREFSLQNQLYCLEAAAIERPSNKV